MDTRNTQQTMTGILQASFLAGDCLAAATTGVVTTLAVRLIRNRRAPLERPASAPKSRS